MGRRGPPPRTPEERGLAGTSRRDRTPPKGAAPEYDALGDYPAPPKDLTPDGAEMWRELGPQLARPGILQKPDVYALEQLCALWGKFRASQRPGKDGGASPEFSASDHNALRALFVEFGLTPSARRRIAASLLDPNKPAPATPGNRFSAHRRRPT